MSQLSVFPDRGAYNPVPMRFSLVLAAAILVAGCGGRGAAKLDDQLIWAANRMNFFNENQRTVTYVHDNQSPYWVVAAPDGTSADSLAGLLPSPPAQVIKDCFQNGQHVLAVFEQTTWDCVRSPTSFPRIAQLMVIAKGAGETTTLVIDRHGPELELTSMK